MSAATSLVDSPTCGYVGESFLGDNRFAVYCQKPIIGQYVVVFNTQHVEMKLCEIMVNAGK